MSRTNLLLSLAALAVAVLYVEVRRPPPAGSALPSRAADADHEPILRRLEALERVASDVGEIKELLEARAGFPAPAPPAAGKPGPGEPPVSPREANGRAAKADAFLAKLARGRVTAAEIDALWEYLPGSGREKEVVEAFKEYVARFPEEADAHYGLGVALTNLFLGGKASQLEIMTLSAQADAEFTKALEIDDRHFGARLSKAISYTFYPSMAGVGPEAIRHFEILRERHGGDSSNEMMKEVYFNLGKEYQKAGNFEKAQEVFREGLQVFPDERRLRSQLEAMGK